MGKNRHEPLIEKQRVHRPGAAVASAGAAGALGPTYPPVAVAPRAGAAVPPPGGGVRVSWLPLTVRPFHLSAFDPEDGN